MSWSHSNKRKSVNVGIFGPATALHECTLLRMEKLIASKSTEYWIRNCAFQKNHLQPALTMHKPVQQSHSTPRRRSDQHSHPLKCTSDCLNAQKLQGRMESLLQCGNSFGGCLEASQMKPDGASNGNEQKTLKALGTNGCSILKVGQGE